MIHGVGFSAVNRHQVTLCDVQKQLRILLAESRNEEKRLEMVVTPGDGTVYRITAAGNVHECNSIKNAVDIYNRGGV